MSEIDLKDLNLGQELAVSEVQSVSDLDEHFQLFPLLPANALHKSNHPNYRLSETVANRRPHSIITNNSRGSYREESQRNSGREQVMRGETFGQGEVFECRCCQGQGQDCAFCGDERVIKGNSNIIKFFEYVIAFKLGSCQSYGQKRLASTATRQSVNQFCSDFYNNKAETQSQYSIRDSELAHTERTDRLSMRSKKGAKSDLGKQITGMPAIHENYSCDVCKVAPIVGNRYRCSECEDYDECEQCHMRAGHRHLMERIEKSGRARQMESMVQMLASQQLVGRASLKAPPSIKKSMDMYSVTTRSALH